MRKFEIDHLRTRILEVTRCTNGNVSTHLNKYKKGTGLTEAKKFKLIQDKKATLKPLLDLSNNVLKGYDHRMSEAVLQCFEYPTTDSQQKKINFNNTIDARISEIHTEIELEGKRILDRAMLSIITADEIPDELYRLGEMVQLAMVWKPKEI